MNVEFYNMWRTTSFEKLEEPSYLIPDKNVLTNSYFNKNKETIYALSICSQYTENRQMFWVSSKCFLYDSILVFLIV